MTKERRRILHKRVVFVPDIHFPFEDPIALGILWSFLVDYKPDIIVLLGDLLDCYLLSSFSKNPNRGTSMQEEFNKGRAFIERLRTTFPSARIIFKEGNHEERLQRYLVEQARGLHGLDDLHIVRQLRLQENAVEFYSAKELCTLGNSFVLTHGSIVRQKSGYTATGEMYHWNASGISGHTHRMSNVYRTTMQGTTTWLECGCLCDLRPCYGKDRILDWQQGFAVADYYPDTDDVRPMLVPIRNGEAHYSGKIYKQDKIVTPRPSERTL